MKAIRIHAFGEPDVLAYEDVPTPVPGANEVLIRIYAAGANPVDGKIRSGHFPRFHPNSPVILGRDFSGVIESLGTGVTGWKPRQEVYGMLDYDRGAYAEFAVANIKEIAPKPASIDHVHAAAIPVAALTAWQGLFDHGGLTSGKRVLIHGGGGGVGHFAVQFAKNCGAEVFTTANPRDFNQLLELGIKNVIDYKSERFEDKLSDIDVVLDLIGGVTRERSWSVLRPGGVLVSTLGMPVVPTNNSKLTSWWKQLPGDPVPPPQLSGPGREVIVQANGEQLREIARMVDEGKVRIVVSMIFPLVNAKQAHMKLESEHFPGKMVLSVT